MGDVKLDNLKQVQMNDQIIAHLWIVRSVAAQLKQTLLFSADWDELISAGNLALVQAAHRYEGRNGCQFKTFAYKWVRGEMIKAFTRIDGHHNSALIEWEPLEDRPIAAQQIEDVYRFEIILKLNLSLARLKARHRDTIIAEYYEDRPLTEVARNARHNRDRVMKWKRTALKHLRQSMA